MSQNPPEIVIIKRPRKHEEEHHGGAWKIAFADFMTAMMAFFLVLWIINATDKNTKTIIARYFNPVRIENATRSTKGIRAPEAAAGSNETDKDSATKSGAADAGTSAAALDRVGSEGATAQSALGGAVSKADAPKATMSEFRLFADPYASLDRILAESAGTKSPGAGQDMPRSTVGLPDPFEPGARGDRNGLAVPARSAGPVVGSQLKTPADGGVTGDNAAKSGQGPEEGIKAARRPADQAVEPSRPPAAAAPQRVETAAPGAAPARALVQRLKDELGAEFGSKAAPNIEINATSEGTLISLTDQANFSMFAIGSAQPQAKVVKLVETIGGILKSGTQAVIVRGFTDGHPYRSASYDNWRLSSARAQMVYYMLIRGGLAESRVERIEGFADRRLKDTAHPFAAVNRRVEILVRDGGR